MKPEDYHGIRVHIRTVAVSTTPAVVVPASQARVGIAFFTTEGTNTVFLYPYGNTNDSERLAIIKETGIVFIPGDLAAHDWQGSVSAGFVYLSVIEYFKTNAS